MTLSMLIYALMAATFVALAGVLAFDAVAAVRRRSAHRQPQVARPTPRPPAASGTRRSAATGS